MILENVTLKGLRKAKNVQASAIAEHIRVSLKTYYDKERDPKQFTINQALSICSIFKIEIDDFMKLQAEEVKK